MIHTIDAGQIDLSFLPRQPREIGPRPAKLDHSLSEGQIRATLAGAGSPPPMDTAVLLHGDYWPGNILWREGRLVAVIDWEEAQIGDPLADLGNARLEILWAFGADAMELFTAETREASSIDIGGLANWDLRAALRPAGKLESWGLDQEPLTDMRAAHRWFVDQAIGHL